MASTSKLLFRKGLFIAVRHDNGWWLAQLYTHIFRGTKKARIRWFDEYSDSKTPNAKIFKRDECNDIPTESVFTSVQVKRVSNTPLLISVSLPDCRAIDEDLLECQQGKVNESAVIKSSTRAKRRVKQNSASPAKPAKLTRNRKRKPTDKPTPRAKKKKVTCYPNIVLYETNLLYDPKNPNIPKVAPSVDSLIFVRAVKNKQYAEVRRLYNDKTAFSYPHYFCNEGRCKQVSKSAWHYAVDNRDKKMIKLLKDLDTEDKKKGGKIERIPGTDNLLSVVDTGTYNPASLGVRCVRPLTMARGSREGVNAFAPLSYVESEFPECTDIIKYAIKVGCTLPFIRFMVSLLENNDNASLIAYFKCAVMNNNRDVAAGIGKESVSFGFDADNFNLLMREVLSFDKGEKLSAFKSVSCHKKTNSYWGEITALHLAALNPSAVYLKQMLQADPQLEIADGSGFKLIHYAASATTSSATKLLLASNVNPLTTTSQGITPLMRAAKLGSVENIEALVGFAYAEHFQSRAPGPINPKRIVDMDLIKKVTKAAGRVLSGIVLEGEDGEESVMLKQRLKQGIGGMESAVLKGVLQSYTALTLAVEFGRDHAVKVLLDLGADPNKSTGAAKRKMAPIHIAAKYGYLEIMKSLILHGAKTRTKDRHGLTAFHYAAKFNQVHCVSWLAANCVADADVADSSGNTALQYACAGGCILVVQYLVEVLKVVVTVKNSWAMTALEVALLRQQMGVVEYLLNSTDADINFRDNAGATVIMKFCAYDMDSENCTIMAPLKFLLSKSGVDLLAVDNEGCNALQYLATQRTGIAENYEELLPLLLEFGLDINSKTSNGKTSLHIAVSNSSAYNSTNEVLIAALIKHGAQIADVRLETNQNIVQHFASLPCQESFLTVIQVIESASTPTLLREMMTHRDDQGMSALHIITQQLVKPGSKDRKAFALQIFECFMGSKFQADINSEVTKRKIDDKSKCNCDFEKNGYHSYRSCPLYPYTEHGKFRPLNFAMKNGDTKDVEKILEYKPNLNYSECSGMYPLHHLVKDGQHELISKFIQEGALTNVLPGCGESHDNAYADYPVLVLAALFCTDGIMLLVEAGACVLAVAPDGCNALHHIVSSYTDLHKRITITEKLLPMVEKIDETDGEGNSYLHHAISGVEHGSNVSIEMISLLLLKGAKPSLRNAKGQTPLHFAFLDKHGAGSTEFSDPIEVVSILTNVMDAESIRAPDLYHGFTPLHLSAMRGGSVASMHLIFHGCQVDTLDNQGNTPLTLAINGLHQSCALMLMEKGASIDKSVMHPIFRQEPYVPNSTNVQEEKKDEELKYDWLPLTEKPLLSPPVITTSNLILYKVIGYNWQGVSFKLVDLLEDPFIPLEAAISLKKYNLAITLLLKFGKKVKPTGCNSKGQTLVHCISRTPGFELELQNRLLRLLIKFNHGISSKDSYKCIPLHYCCLVKKLEMCKVLVKPNTVNCRDSFGRTPICALYWNGYPEEQFVRFLVGEGASLDITCDYNLQESDHPIFDYEFGSRQSDYFTSFSERYTLLIKAVIENKPKEIDLLLELGAHINTPSSRGLTPLMYAAKLNMPGVFAKLLARATPDAFRVKSDDGKTVLHYAVLTYPQAYLNEPSVLQKSVEFLKNNKTALSDTIRLVDNFGVSVTDICKDNPVYRKILGLSGTDNKCRDKPMLSESSEVDFVTDSKKYFEDVHDLAARQKLAKLAKPDSSLSLSEDECEVYQDDQSGKYYDVLMTKVDIKARHCSLYNFYKLQLIRNKGKDIYLLLTKWGRIGDEGQHQETPFTTLEECKTEFDKVFKAKTKNDWNNLENFVPDPLKYRVVSREWRYHDQYKNIEYEFGGDKAPFGMEKSVFNVLLEACDLDNIGRLLEDHFQLNASRLAFGFIKPEAICRAEAILNELETLDEGGDERSTDLSNPETLDDFRKKAQSRYDLTNEIYQLIPQKGYHITNIRPIFKRVISDWRKQLVNLRDMEIVSRIMAGSQLNKQQVHPIQYIYNCLNCGVQPLDPHDATSQFLIRNIYAATGSCNQIKGMFRLTPRFKDTRPTGRKKLLYHGISTGTLLSILKRGLQHAPYSKTHGAAHGEGIYLADNIQKSLSYASGSSSRFVLVLSAVLGKVQENVCSSVDDDDMVGDFDTVWVVGKQQQDSTHDVLLEGGAKMGMGRFQKVKRGSFVLKDPKRCLNHWDGTTRNVCKIKNFLFENTNCKGSRGKFSAGYSSDDSGNSEEDDSDKEDDSDQGKQERLMDLYAFRYMPEHNEFVIKDSKNVRLEYLIQIR